MPTDQTGPIKKHLQTIQSNRHQAPTSQPSSLSSSRPQKKKSWTGFAGKTLWQWLNFGALFLVPLMIGIFTIATTNQQNQISQSQHDNDQRIAKENHDIDIQIATDQQQTTILKTYIDDITDLMLNHGLRDQNSNIEVKVVARVKTLAALRGLDPIRKGDVIQFLYEAALIGGVKNPQDNTGYDALVSLEGADLRKARLVGINLIAVKLTGVDLEGADLSGTNLQAANLEKTKLNEAKLNRTDLRYTDLRGAHLNKADLQEVQLDGADLSVIMHGADILVSGTDLTDAKVTKEQLKNAKSLSGTTLPDGSTCPIGSSSCS